MIPTTVAVTRTVAAPAEALWRVLRTGADVDRILPDLIRTCTVQGEGPGARRTCGTDQGPIEETLLAVDDAARLFRYRIDAQSMMPVADYTGAIHVVELGPGRAQVLWFASFQLTTAGAEEGVRQALTGLFTSGIDGLAALALEVA